MIPAPVGYKCPKCAKTKLAQIQEITTKQYIIGGLSGFIIGSGAGYIWYNLSMYGLLVSLLVAYTVGFCVSRAISKSIGNKIGLRVQVLAAIITVISMVYNPILVAMYFFQGVFPSFISIIFALSFFCVNCFIKLLAVVIAVWAAIRHFRF